MTVATSVGLLDLASFGVGFTLGRTVDVVLSEPHLVAFNGSTSSISAFQQSVDLLRFALPNLSSRAV